ncbi:MAG: acetylornithine deacetylase [Azospirillaceae bacterium]
MPSHPSSRDLLRTLIGFPTVSRDSNLALIHFIRDYLADLGVESLLVPDGTGKKANLYATIGPADRPGICLSGHTDVVPVEDQDWSHDPFDLVERDGRLYGRGTADMKGFVAIALAWAPRFLAARLATPVHYAFSYDEEVGCIGVRGLLKKLEAMPVRPKACVVGEPTSMTPVIAHKGKLSMRAHVHGLEGHSSMTQHGVNAVEYAAEMVAFLRALAREKRDQGPFDDGFDPPYTTVHTGTFAGGTALNIIPNKAAVEFEFRHLPVDDPRELFDRVERFVREELEPEMKTVAAAAGFDFEEITSFPGLAMQEADPEVALVKALSGANATGKVAFGTEAGLFQQAGIPAVICGPGSIEQAHRPDEWISLDQMRRGERFMDRLIERLAA